MPFHRRREGGDVSAIFVHAGAGFHSFQNEKHHLSACNDAAKAAMTILKNGGEAVDAVEMAIRVMEDREITNAGYGSNLAMDGSVECDATIVDQYGRSGAVGAVSQIKNPISLARLVLDASTKPLSLQRVPPNLLVGPGAANFACDNGMPVLPHDFLISTPARERWLRWKQDLKIAEHRDQDDCENDMDVDQETTWSRSTSDDRMTSATVGNTPPESPPSTEATTLLASTSTSITPPIRPLVESASDTPNLERRDYIDYSFQSACSLYNPFRDQGSDGLGQGHPKKTKFQEAQAFTDDDVGWAQRAPKLPKLHDGSSDSDSSMSSISSMQLPSVSPSPPPFAALHTPLPPSPSDQSSESIKTETGGLSDAIGDMSPLPMTSNHAGTEDRDDEITDTVGAIAVDCYGNIAAGSSSGGIGMKHRGRTGPAALVGVGSAVIPVDPEDPHKVCVATVTSGTGEHMATTMAASTCAERIYANVRKKRGGGIEYATEEEAMRSMIEKEFMDHPGVKHSHCAGAIGVMAIKKSREGVFFYFGHNTDSFAVASMNGEDKKPVCTMSRSSGNGSIAQGGRAARFHRRYLH